MQVFFLNTLFSFALVILFHISTYTTTTSKICRLYQRPIKLNVECQQNGKRHRNSESSLSWLLPPFLGLLTDTSNPYILSHIIPHTPTRIIAHVQAALSAWRGDVILQVRRSRNWDGKENEMSCCGVWSNAFSAKVSQTVVVYIV